MPCGAGKAGWRLMPARPRMQSQPFLNGIGAAAPRRVTDRSARVHCNSPTGAEAAHRRTSGRCFQSIRRCATWSARSEALPKRPGGHGRRGAQRRTAARQCQCRERKLSRIVKFISRTRAGDGSSPAAPASCRQTHERDQETEGRKAQIPWCRTHGPKD